MIDTNSEIYTSMASSSLTLMTIRRENVLKSQVQFLIQILFFGGVIERVATSFHIVTRTLSVSSSTVNSLMIAGSPFFVFTDLTVSYIIYCH